MREHFEGYSWFAAICQPGKSVEAHNRLLEQGYKSFLPMCRRLIRHARRQEIVTRPLFDRYLFVGLEDGQSLYPVHSTRGVSSVVRGASFAPSRVPIAALCSIQARCDQDGGIVDFLPVRSKVLPDWQIGQELRVLDGPFQDFVAIFSGYEGSVAKIILDLFGRSTIVSAKTHSLEPTASPRSAAAILRAA